MTSHAAALRLRFVLILQSHACHIHRNDDAYVLANNAAISENGRNIIELPTIHYSDRDRIKTHAPTCMLLNTIVGRY